MPFRGALWGAELRGQEGALFTCRLLGGGEEEGVGGLVGVSEAWGVWRWVAGKG